MKNFIFGILTIALCAAGVTAQSKAGDKGGLSQSPSTSSNANGLQKGWQVYNLGSKDAFRVALPQKPVVETENLKEGSLNMKVTYFTASSDDVLTVIADIYDLPSGSQTFTENDKLYIFKKVREGLIDGMEKELKKSGMNPEINFSEQKKIALKNASGYEQDLTVGPIKGKARMLSSPNHIFIFFTLLLEDSKEFLMNDFLNSFEYGGSK